MPAMRARWTPPSGRRSARSCWSTWPTRCIGTPSRARPSTWSRSRGRRGTSTTRSSKCTSTTSGWTNNRRQRMRTYILKRLLQIVPTILGITFVVFIMMQSIPGDPVVSLLGDAYTEENAIKARQDYGLDKPVLLQYVIWLGKLAQGDWGASILSGRPVLKDVLVRLPVTLELIVLSMAVALAIAVPAAIVGALRQNTWAAYTATTVAMIGVSIPEFFAGILLLLVFSFGLGGLLPSSGWIYLPGTCPSIVCGVSFWGNATHVLMPAVALGIGRAAILTRLLRASMLEVIRT